LACSLQEQRRQPSTSARQAPGMRSSRSCCIPHPPFPHACPVQRSPAPGPQTPAHPQPLLSTPPRQQEARTFC
jgi:hypothetical protein